MARRRLVTEILFSLLLVVLLALAAATWNAFHALRLYHFEATASNLEVSARLIEPDVNGFFDPAGTPAIQNLCKEYAKRSGVRVTLILPSGKVIGDSEDEPARMDNHADRPEIKTALAGNIGHATRHSYTLRADLLYVAVPSYRDGKLAGVVRTSLPLASMNEILNHVLWRVGLGSLAVVLIAAAVSFVLARRIARPLQVMEAGARRFAEGRFDTRLPMAKHAELAALGSAMNAMASQLRDRIQAMERQKEEIDAVLGSMIESVIAVDERERVVLLNPAAARLFGISIESASGRPVQEIVRNPKLQQCLARVLATAQPIEDDVVLVDATERYLHIFASTLRDEQGQQIGALLVLDDVTQLRRLERARSDFIANVSHEIRTPITSIKGYAETLLGEAEAYSETARRFLETILRQADRLSSLVDDILSLGSLERSEIAGDITFDLAGVGGIIDAAVNVCAPKADEKGITVRVRCPGDLEVRAHAFLIEQALVNLLDNAIKYSAPASEVTIEAEEVAGEVAIRVRDTGAGIAQEHLPRIFERFYRVDKARSRRLGGTGLGLAIVKHIVNLHNGRISVDSTLGKGSCFAIQLPAGNTRKS